MTQRKKLAIVTTHPIQYNAPFFRRLAEYGEVDVKVFYTWEKGAGGKHDPGFGRQVEWDVPLLEGYPYTFVKNRATDPGSHHYQGILCPTLIDEINEYAPSAILVYGWNFHAHLHVMRHFKGRIPVWFRGDSTLLDYDFRSVKEVWRYYAKRGEEDRKQKTENRKQRTEGRGQGTRDERRGEEGRKQKAEGRRQKAEDRGQGTRDVRRETGEEGKKTGDGGRKTEDGGQRTEGREKINPIFSYLKFLTRKLYLTHIYRNINKALYVGTHNKDYFLAHGMKELQLVRMPHAVDNDFFSRDNETREQAALEWRRTLGILDDDFVVLFAGKFEPKKNPELLLKAVMEINEGSRRQKAEDRGQKAEVRGQRSEVRNEELNEAVKRMTASNSEISQQQGGTLAAEKVQEDASSSHHLITSSPSLIHLVMVGNGLLEDKLNKLATGKLYLHFLPFQNQSKMPVVYRLGNVFCLPSQGPGETWGLAVNEAMACNRPAIVSDKTGCAPDLIDPEKSGAVFQSGDLEELKQCIVSEQKRQGYKTCAEKLAEYSIDYQVTVMNNLLMIR